MQQHVWPAAASQTHRLLGSAPVLTSPCFPWQRRRGMSVALHTCRQIFSQCTAEVRRSMKVRSEIEGGMQSRNDSRCIQLANIKCKRKEQKHRAKARKAHQVACQQVQRPAAWRRQHRLQARSNHIAWAGLQFWQALVQALCGAFCQSRQGGSAERRGL